jgi:hemoglobin
VIDGVDERVTQPLMIAFVMIVSHELLHRPSEATLTDAQRQRFVEIVLEAADEAGLPNDERFRRGFREYIEWGSRIAMDISQPGADITTREPVPRWGWD